MYACESIAGESLAFYASCLVGLRRERLHMRFIRYSYLRFWFIRSIGIEQGP